MDVFDVLARIASDLSFTSRLRDEAPELDGVRRLLQEAADRFSRL